MTVVHRAGGSPIWFDLDCCFVLSADEEVGRRRTDVTGDALKVIAAPEDAPGRPFKLLATFPSDRISAAVKSLSAAFTDRHSVVQSGPNLVELVSPAARQDFAAAFIASAGGMDAGHVAAAGDSDNDLEMLRWAGLAITVANAKPHIPNAADVIAPPCDVGGLGKALDWLFQQINRHKGNTS